jgi:hypothetical protein
LRSLLSGIIDLNECSLRKSETAKKANSFEIVASTRVYVLYADTDASFKEWISALNKAVGMCLLHSLIVRPLWVTQPGALVQVWAMDCNSTSSRR